MEPAPTRIGRYEVHGAIARGGMATIRLGRIRGDGGFSRVVAIKHLHEHVARDPEFAAMLLDEARLASRIRHPNVVTIFDVVTEGEHIYLIMEYVHGETLAGLLRAARREKETLAPAVAVAIAVDALAGLHAAHRALDARGMPLGIVHRDVSPHNVIVGADGSARILDFGVAKAVAKLHTTRAGTLKGTLPYMAPENLRGEDATVRSDLHAVGCVLWEALTGERLFRGDNEAVILGRVLEGVRRPPSSAGAKVPHELDAVVLRAIHREPRERFADAGEMASALRAALPPAPADEVATWVERLARASLEERLEQLAAVEQGQRWAEAGGGRAQDATRTALPAADPPGGTTTVALSSVSEPLAARRAPSWLLLGAVLLAGVGLYAVLGPGTASTETARAGGLSPRVSLPEPAPPQPPESAAPEPAPPASGPPKSAPPETARAAARPLPPARPSIDCNPPVERDAHGILRVKPGCDRAGGR